MLAGGGFDVAYRHKTEFSSITISQTIQAASCRPHFQT